MMNPSSRPKLSMPHPNYPRLQIPAARVMGVGRQPALPAGKLYPGDKIVLDYGEVYKLLKKVSIRPNVVRLDMVSGTGIQTHRTVSLTSHIAVSWGTFNKRWTAPTKNGGKAMACKGKKANLGSGKKVNLTGGQLDLHSPINSGVSFHGKVDLTKQKKSRF